MQTNGGAYGLDKDSLPERAGAPRFQEASKQGMWLRSLVCVLILVAGGFSQNETGQNASASKKEPPLVAAWSASPKLVGTAVIGSVVVTNGTDDAFDQTVLVEAVNGIGKAFTLGYQHFTLPAHSQSKKIEFNTTLPPGSYQVRVDAVAEVATRNAIFRQHLVAPTNFVINTI